jgi:iron-sulfur cluster repair protein YtfE (RIC family)
MELSRWARGVKMGYCSNRAVILTGVFNEENVATIKAIVAQYSNLNVEMTDRGAVRTFRITEIIKHDTR